MNTTLLNNPTKFGAKIFRRYQVITFYVVGHFLAAPCRYEEEEGSAKFWHLAVDKAIAIINRPRLLFGPILYVVVVVVVIIIIIIIIVMVMWSLVNLRVLGRR